MLGIVRDVGIQGTVRDVGIQETVRDVGIQGMRLLNLKDIKGLRFL